jgi:thioester reductase-like protein
MNTEANSQLPKTVYLLTGATGLVGRHVLGRLAQHPDARVLALVRPSSVDRLQQLLADLPGRERVEPLVGDIRAPQLGLSGFQGGVDHLVHVAAAYDLTADHRAVWETNVLGTANVVAFANQIGAGCLHHTSTIGVAGRNRGRFSEADLERGQLLDNPYFRSKWYAERILRALARVPTRIYRPGVVVGDSRTGAMTKVDGAYYALAGLRRLARLPDWLPLVGPRGGLANIVPVDWVAAVMDTLIHLPQDRLPGSVFHLVPDRAGSVGDAVNSFARAAGAPQIRVQVGLGLTRPLAKALRLLPASARLRDLLWSWVGIPPRAMDWRDFDAVFDRTNLTRAVSEDAPCPRLDSYAGCLYRYWLEHLVA